jgi:hypothetical protein
MIIILGLAYGFDILIKMLKVQNGMTYDLTTVLMWTYSATNLVVMGTLLLFFWGIMTKTNRPAWVGGIFLAVGGLLVVSPGLYIAGLLGNFAYFPLPNSLVFTAGGGMAAIGLLVLGLRIYHRSSTLDQIVK